MRRFGVFLLTILLVLNKLWFIGVLILMLNGEFGAAQVATMGLVFIFLWAMLAEWRSKLRRKIPPRHWTPPKLKKEKKQKPVPEIIEPAAQPQAAAPRRLAPIPLAQAIEQPTQPSVSAMPDRMRRFIERGDQAIHATPEPSDAEAEPEAANQVADPFAPAQAQPPEPKPNPVALQPPPMPSQQS